MGATFQNISTKTMIVRIHLKIIRAGSSAFFTEMTMTQPMVATATSSINAPRMISKERLMLVCLDYLRFEGGSPQARPAKFRPLRRDQMLQSTLGFLTHDVFGVPRAAEGGV